MNFKKLRLVFVLCLPALMLVSGCSSPPEALYQITNQDGMGVYPSQSEKEEAIKIYKGYINNLKTLPVSFTYDNVTYKGFGNDFKEISRKVDKNEQKVSHTIELMLKKDLKITIKSAVYPDYCAYEWTAYFENVGEVNSAKLMDVHGAEMIFKGENPVLKGIYGDGGVGEGPYSPYSFDMKTKDLVNFSPETGRSTYNHFPYFNLERGTGGVLIAIGWPVMWDAQFKNEEDGLHFTGGQKTLKTYLKPGEIVRTPLMSFVEYSGRDESRTMNLWRHWFMDCNMRKIEGELFQPVISGGTSWIYEEMAKATDKNQIAAMKAYTDNKIPISYWWMDAGWYYKTGTESLSTWLDTGTWMVDTKRFPSEFAAITDYGKSVGVKTLLWFEPEVVRLNWQLHDDQNGIPREYMIDDNLANFGNDDYVNWCVNRVSSIIDKGGISLYRQDYGLNPAPNFANSNTKDRAGIVENLYAQGYLKYWDKLIEKYPNMMLDSCAAGGGRNDLESMRRAIPLHKTDHDYSDFTSKQAMHQTLFQWLPYFGTPVSGPDLCGKADEYSLRSSFAPWVAMGYNVNNRLLDWETVKQCSDEWMKIKNYFYDDYYPLTTWSNENKDWRGWEFINPILGEGYIQLFRAPKCEIKEQQIKLFGLEADAMYTLTDLDGVCSTQANGRELMENGFLVVIPQMRSSAIVLIQKVK